MEDFKLDNITGRNNAGPHQNEPLRYLCATSIIGDKVFKSTGEELGKINDIMIDLTQGKVEYVVIKFGGFLGLNQKYLAVPMHAITPAKEHQDAFILNETQESLSKYPGFDSDHWPNTNSKGFGPG